MLSTHQGAIADAKSAVAWYQKRSPKAALDFIEEMHRAAETIREAPERQERTTLDDSCFGDSRLPSSIPNENP